MQIRLQEALDGAPLGPTWRELETRAELSFFQSWTWTGCLLEERFPAPLLLSAAQDGVVVALGLFNRQALSWHLGEAGAAAPDSIYIEHNGFLRARANAPDVATLLRAVRGHRRIPRRIALSGVDDAHLAAAHATGARVLIRREHIAPRLDLAAAGVDWIASRSANTRQQLRRSARAYGAVRMERAMTVAVAWEYLDALATLHQRRWHARGKPGAFAQTFFARFHRELIARGLPRDEIDLLRISAEGAVIGYLYNFRHRGRVLAYQSGFNYAAARGAQKPGMTCHQMAIDWYAAQGVRAYDFLAGADRYKRSLANAQTRLHWLSLYPVLSDLWRG